MNRIEFVYDYYRGGFHLTVGHEDNPTSGVSTVEESYDPQGRPVHRSSGLWQCRAVPFWARFDPNQRLIELRSDFGRGGVPFRGSPEQPPRPATEEPLEQAGGLPDDLRLGDRLQLRQSAHRFALWFSNGDHLPREHWLATPLGATGVVVYYSTQAVEHVFDMVHPLAGIAVDFQASTLTYPIERVTVRVEDFKA